MMRLQKALLENALGLANGRRPSYRVRLKIERAVFEAVREATQLECGHEVRRIDSELIGRLTEQECATCVRLAETGYRAIHELRELASFDPYVVAGDCDSETAVRPIPTVLALRQLLLEMEATLRVVYQADR